LTTKRVPALWDHIHGKHQPRVGRSRQVDVASAARSPLSEIKLDPGPDRELDP